MDVYEHRAEILEKMQQERMAKDVRPVPLWIHEYEESMNETIARYRRLSRTYKK